MQPQMLREIRYYLGMSQSELATALGYRGDRNARAVQICRWETGKRPIPERIARLADALMRIKGGVPTDYRRKPSRGFDEITKRRRERQRAAKQAGKGAASGSGPGAPER